MWIKLPHYIPFTEVLLNSFKVCFVTIIRWNQVATPATGYDNIGIFAEIIGIIVHIPKNDVLVIVKEKICVCMGCTFNFSCSQTMSVPPVAQIS